MLLVPEILRSCKFFTGKILLISCESHENDSILQKDDLINLEKKVNA